jgi:hypothetical protein
MAVKTTWDVEHACGHSQVHDLSTKRVSERAGFARWLAGRDCTDCWARKRDTATGRDRDAWLAERRAEELSVVEMWETKAGMPPLEGSDKAVEWARKVRHQLAVAAFNDMGSPDDADFTEHIEAPTRAVTSASWWIDQRESEPSDLAELLADAAADGVAHVNENPY